VPVFVLTNVIVCNKNNKIEQKFDNDYLLLNDSQGYFVSCRTQFSIQNSYDNLLIIIKLGVVSYFYKLSIKMTLHRHAKQKEIIIFMRVAFIINEQNTVTVYT